MNKRRLCRILKFVLIAAFIVLLVFIALVYWLSYRENRIEDVIQSSYANCYRRHGFVIKDHGENIPASIVKLCEKEEFLPADGERNHD